MPLCLHIIQRATNTIFYVDYSTMCSVFISSWPTEDPSPWRWHPSPFSPLPFSNNVNWESPALRPRDTKSDSQNRIMKSWDQDSRIKLENKTTAVKSADSEQTREYHASAFDIYLLVRQSSSYVVSNSKASCGRTDTRIWIIGLKWQCNGRTANSRRLWHGPTVLTRDQWNPAHSTHSSSVSSTDANVSMKLPRMERGLDTRHYFFWQQADKQLSLVSLTVSWWQSVTDSHLCLH